MREIKKVDAQQQIPNVDQKQTGKADPQFCGELTGHKVVNDLSGHTEIVGRSQVNDNIHADVTFGLNHPEAISSSDKFFDMAYAQLVKDNDPNAYEKASAMATLYAKELYS